MKRVEGWNRWIEGMFIEENQVRGNGENYDGRYAHGTEGDRTRNKVEG